MKRLILLFILSIVFISCGQETETSKVEINFSQSVTGSWRDGGLIVFGENNHLDAFVYVLEAGSTVFNQELPKGVWNIHIIAWDGAGNGYHMKGTSRCGHANVNLEDDMQIGIDLSQDNCTSSAGQFDYGHRADTDSDGIDDQFTNLDVQVCMTSACTTSDRMVGANIKYRFAIKAGAVFGGTYVPVPGVLLSDCYDPSTPGVSQTNGVNVPFKIGPSGAGLSVVRMRVFDSNAGGNCESDATSFFNTLALGGDLTDLDDGASPFVYLKPF